MRQLLFKLARSGIARFFIGFAFARLSRLMPLKRVTEDALCILFLHPSPFWETHWLGVPKKRIASFAALDLDRDAKHIHSILRHMIEVGDERGIRPRTILVNGGSYQDVPQLHFHFTHGLDRNEEQWGTERFAESSVTPNADEIQVIEHPEPQRERQWQLAAKGTNALEEFEWNSAETTTLTTLLKSAQQLITREQLTAYTLIFALDVGEPCLCAHLVSEGKAA